MFIIRRKDVPVYEGAKTFWITVGKRNTEQDEKKLVDTLKRISKKGTGFWYGEEKEFNND